MFRRRLSMAREPQSTVAESVAEPPIKKHKGKVTRMVAPPVSIDGELFQMRVMKRRVTLTHERWSLMGSGPTLGDAEVALRREASAVVRVFGAMDPATLDDDATNLLIYALRVAAD